MSEVCCCRCGASRRAKLRCCGCPMALDLLGEHSRSRIVSFCCSLACFLFIFRSLFTDYGSSKCEMHTTPVHS